VKKTTLLRAIKAGKVSGNKDEQGQWHVEPAELHRVYPPVTQRADTEAPHYHATAALEAEIAGLRQVGELLRGQLEATRQDRYRWAEAAGERFRKLALENHLAAAGSQDTRHRHREGVPLIG
jgi:hypothetical protein